MMNHIAGASGDRPAPRSVTSVSVAEPLGGLELPGLSWPGALARTGRSEAAAHPSPTLPEEAGGVSSLG